QCSRGRIAQSDQVAEVPLRGTRHVSADLAGGERLPQRFGYGNFCHRTPPSRACWMNGLSAMARRSSLPKRIDRPCEDAYCSAARAASMLAVSAARNAVSVAPALAGVLAGVPFPL